jgi:nucleotide-binding universal stress UspA family protein
MSLMCPWTKCIRRSRKARKRSSNGVKDIERTVITGVPHEEIINLAKKHKVDLIVMGTHGRKGVDRILFGSTAAQIVRFAPCPVLTVRLPMY